MVTIAGIYDVKANNHIDRIVKDSCDESQFRKFSSDSSSMIFWNNPKEDIYQDYLSVEHLTKP